MVNLTLFLTESKNRNAGIDYVSVNSKPDHSPGDSRDSHGLTALGVGFSKNFLCPGGHGFESKKFSTVLTISVILIKFSDHPRVIFANVKSSLKFLSVLHRKLYL